MTCSIYRHYDAKGALLYVGMAICPFNRFSQNYGYRKDLVARMDIEWFDTREQASIAEREAIIAEKPIHNGIRYRSGVKPKPRKVKPKPAPYVPQFGPAGDVGARMQVQLRVIDECEKYGVPLDSPDWERELAEAKAKKGFDGLLEHVPLADVEPDEEQGDV